jgi:hypothetical protein
MSKLNPQKASAYVGPGVLRKGGKITPVPNGPLIKKKGPYAGSTLKTGGKIKKAQDGFNKIKPGTKQTTPKYHIPESRFVITNDTAKVKPTRWINNPMPPSKDKEKFPMPSEALMDSVSKASVRNIDTSKLMKKKAQTGGTIKKAQNGTSQYSDPKPLFDKIKKSKDSLDNAMFKLEEKKFKSKMDYLKSKLKNKESEMNTKKAKAGAMIKRAQNGESFTKDGNEYTYTKQVTRPEGKRKYEGKSIDQATAMKIANFKIRNNPSDSLRTVKPVIKKNGGLIKRADGSMSKRGLWDNIRANKGSGKKPTKQMLVQERKIKAKSKK